MPFLGNLINQTWKCFYNSFLWKGIVGAFFVFSVVPVFERKAGGWMILIQVY